MIVGGIAAGLVLIGLVAFFTLDRTRSTPLTSLVRKDLPTLDLKLQFRDAEGEDVPVAQTRLERGAAGDEKTSPAPVPSECSDLIGGDTSEATAPDPKKTRKGCPNVATWFVKRHPIAYSFYFLDADKVLAAIDNDGPVKRLLDTKLIRGAFIDLLHSANVRAEDIKLQGIEGAFLTRLVRDALKAHGELHYDIAHGKKGFVFSFVKNESILASRTLPVICATLARSGFRAKGLDEPVIEMRIGLQRLFLTQQKGRVYLANGLEALLNVLESLDPAGKDMPEAPLVVTVRAEAFIGDALPLIAGSSTLALSFGLELTGADPGVLRFKAGKLPDALSPKAFKGVFASVPRDAFAAAVASVQLSPDMTADDWRELATNGPGGTPAGGAGEGGIAVVWDLDSEGKRPTCMGIAIANPKSPGKANQFRQYFTNPDLTAECGGGTVFLAATSQNLLTRMNDACRSQSLSVLDWDRGARKQEIEGSQLLFFVNPAVGMREFLLAGGGKTRDVGEFDPQWKQQVEKARGAMRDDCEKVFQGLPIFGFAGNAPASAELVQLKGFTVKQGGSR